MTDLLTESELKKVQDIIIGQLGVQRDQLLPEARLMGDLGADSLDMVEMSMKVEEDFQVTAPDDVMEKVVTVEDMCDTVAQLLRRGNG